MITDADVREVLRLYGAGKINTAEAAERIRPAYLAATGAYEQRQSREIGAFPHPADEDDASARNAWATVGVALATRVISRKQYDDLMAAVKGH